MATQSKTEWQDFSCATLRSVRCHAGRGRSGIPCFTAGTRIATDNGDRQIEELCVGDRVFTRDHGMRPVRWIGSRKVEAKDQFAPVQIKPGVFNGMLSPLTVSQRHRVLFSGYRSQLLFGVSEVLVAAKDLVDGVAVDFRSGGDVTYIHLMFDSHEIIYANGVPTESFHLDWDVLQNVDCADREVQI